MKNVLHLTVGVILPFVPAAWLFARADSNLSSVEDVLLFIVANIFFWGIGAYLILAVYKKWKNIPVMVSAGVVFLSGVIIELVMIVVSWSIIIRGIESYL